jgi:DNA-binding response OmpR family regulator
LPGWDAYLVKPFLTKDLRSAIDAAIMRHPKVKAGNGASFAPVAGTA